MKVESVRQIIKEFARDFVPYSSGRFCHDVKAVRNVRPAALERCCACVCDDIQSGVIYCGDLAEVVADVANAEGCVVAYCEQHRERMGNHPTAPERQM